MSKRHFSPSPSQRDYDMGSGNDSPPSPLFEPNSSRHWLDSSQNENVESKVSTVKQREKEKTRLLRKLDDHDPSVSTRNTSRELTSGLKFLDIYENNEKTGYQIHDACGAIGIKQVINDFDSNVK